jgi:hypothetical protein
MAKITQYSRISHHTLSGSASATFSIPPSEDFTDGSWNINGTELALSEIGVNEDSKKAYIRINDEIKEFEFIGGTAGGESLSDTLAVGNTTGANDIIVSTDDLIKGGGSSSISLGTTARPNEVKIYTEDASNTNDFAITPFSSVQTITDLSTTNSVIVNSNPDSHQVTVAEIASNITDTFYINPQVGITGITSEDNTTNKSTTTTHTPNTILLASYDGTGGSTNSIQLTDTTTEIGYINDSDEWFSKLQIDGSSPVLNLITGYNNGNLIGRVSTAPGSVTNYVGPNSVSGTYSSVSQTENSWRVLHVENNVEKSDIKVGKDIDNNYRVSVNKTNFAYGTVSTTTSASASVFSLSLPDAGDHSWVKAQVKAITSTFSKSYVADIFGGFRNDGSLNLIGSGYSVIEYTDFTGGARADYDISGTNMLIKVYGETSSTINWSVNVTWG